MSKKHAVTALHLLFGAVATFAHGPNDQKVKHLLGDAN